MFRDQVKFPFKRKMLWNIAWGIMILGAVACNESKPEDILTEKQMVSVLAELYLAKEKAGELPISYDSLRQLLPMFSARVFQKTGIPDTLFQKSFNYYMRDPAKLENIYTVLVDSLNLKTQRARTQQEDVKEKPKEDAVPN